MTARLVTHIRTPLYKNSYALVVSAGGTAVLGLLYWTIAARNYSPHEVGVQSVVISTMLFLSGLSQFSLNSVLIRFLPVARRGTGRLIGGAYIVSAVAAVFVAAVFVLGTPFWSPTLSFLRSDAAWFLAFVGGTAVWCVFTLQDSVLAGLRRATWVPVENIAVSVVKIALLLLFASELPHAGLFASWVIPSLVAVAIVSVMVVRIVLPPLRGQERPESHQLREIVRFAGGNYVGFVFYAASSNLLPLVVLNEVGPTQAAFFFLPWTITSAVRAIPASTATSLTVETVQDMDQLRSYCRRTLVHTFALLAPAVALLCVGASTLLNVFGTGYAAEGSTALRLLALGLLSRRRARSWWGSGSSGLKGLVVRLAALQAFICISLLGVSHYLLPRHGIDGAASRLRPQPGASPPSSCS